MARSISVKVPVATLISSIENKIAEIDEAVANYPAVREQFDKEIELCHNRYIKETEVNSLHKVVTSLLHKRY